MNKSEYAGLVREELSAKGYESFIEENYRNNCSKTAIRIKIPGSAVQPVFSFGDDEPSNPTEFVEYVLSNLSKDVSVEAEQVMEIFHNKEEVLNRVNYILVNSEMNKAHKTITRLKVNSTLELQYKVDINDICPGGRVVLTNDHLETLDIDEEELFDRAYLNTMTTRPYKFDHISTFTGFETPEVPMWILTNSKGINGAGVILYKGMKNLIEAQLGEFIVIPSSVHEVIVMPAITDIDEITAIIRNVNEMVVDPEDVLSDIPYALQSDGVLVEL